MRLTTHRENINRVFFEQKIQQLYFISATRITTRQLYSLQFLALLRNSLSSSNFGFAMKYVVLISKMYAHLCFFFLCFGIRYHMYLKTDLDSAKPGTFNLYTIISYLQPGLAGYNACILFACINCFD